VADVTEEPCPAENPRSWETSRYPQGTDPPRYFSASLRWTGSPALDGFPALDGLRIGDKNSIGVEGCLPVRGSSLSSGAPLLTLGAMADLVIRTLTTADSHDEYADLSIRAFGPRDPAVVWARSEATIAGGRALGAFDGGRLVGTALYLDLQQWWSGRSVPTAGVAGVKVAPEYRGRGAGRALMTALTDLMIERGYSLSALYAATMPLYRQLGWELTGASYEAVIPARSLTALARPDFPAAATRVPLRRPGSADAAEIIAVIGRAHQLARDCGPVTFDEPTVRSWLTAPGSYLDTDKFAYLAPDGFLAYRWNGSEQEIFVDKAVAASQETTLALWSVVASHSSVAKTIRAQVAPSDPIWWLLREQDATISDRDRWMLRLLDAPAAIAARGFPLVDLAVALQVRDDQIPANAGRWTLTVYSGSGELSRASEGDSAVPLELGARGLAALYAGIPVATLRGAGLASGGTPDTDLALDSAFAADAFMLDSF
jgi:predicted acetyltransferase